MGSTEMTQQRAMLQQYAKDQIQAASADIKVNLGKLGIDGFDTVWPGDGYAGVAYGGLWAALLQLQSAGIAKVGNRVGASGGAASTIFTMAGDVDLFLKMYQVYCLYFDGHPDRVARETVRDTGLTSAIYAEATRHDAAFANAQKEAFIASLCSPDWVYPKPTIFRGFQSHEQLVAAGYSSGDASAGGVTVGTVVKGTNIGSCCDGGSVTAFPADAANKNYAVLRYHTTLDGVAYPTPDSVSKLFKAGVETAISTLKSPTLRANGSDGGDMACALPGPSGIVTATEFSKIYEFTDAQVVDLATLSHHEVDIIV